MLTKALRTGFASSMRRSSPRVSSTLDTRRVASSCESSATEAVITMCGPVFVTRPAARGSRSGARLFDYLRHEIQAGSDGRRIFLIQLALVFFHHPVLAQRQRHILGMRHGNDARGIDRAHLFDQAEKTAQLSSDVGGFGVGDIDAGKMGDAFDVFDGERHLPWEESSDFPCRNKAE